jgi:hypothetical protein
MEVAYDRPGERASSVQYQMVITWPEVPFPVVREPPRVRIFKYLALQIQLSPSALPCSEDSS